MKFNTTASQATCGYCQQKVQFDKMGKKCALCNCGAMKVEEQDDCYKVSYGKVNEYIYK
jgi:Zn finger protein HypA/HybF involved in hydrogenase expression